MVDVKRIIVVDDHFRIVDSIKTMLEASWNEYEVIGVPSAEEGIFEIKREPVDLLITDIYLPGMSGAELIVRVNKLWPTLPIIVITGHAEQMGRKEAAESGIVHYFEKPLEPSAFLNAVHSAIKASSVQAVEPLLGGDTNAAPGKTLAVRFIVENLRVDTKASEVLLAFRNGKLIYVTERQESALSVLVPSCAKTVDGLFQLGKRMGSSDPLTYQLIADDQNEIHFATVGTEYFVAVLYSAHSRSIQIDIVWAHMQTALRNILNVVQGDSVSETSDRIDEPLDAAVDEELDAAVDKELDDGPQISPEENSLVEILEDRSPDVSNFEEIELPAIDEGVDLDAFWDDALAEELGGDQSGKGLGFDEARDNGLLPPEFEPGRKTRD
jgi:DNA-binding response OmpR family regulator